MPDNDNGTIEPSAGETQQGQTDGYPTSADYGADSSPNSPDK